MTALVEAALEETMLVPMEMSLPCWPARVTGEANKGPERLLLSMTLLERRPPAIFTPLTDAALAPPERRARLALLSSTEVTTRDPARPANCGELKLMYPPLRRAGSTPAVSTSLVPPVVPPALLPMDRVCSGVKVPWGKAAKVMGLPPTVPVWLLRGTVVVLKRFCTLLAAEF